jgi:membrane-bound lytic murein transglycosylase B
MGRGERGRLGRSLWLPLVLFVVLVGVAVAIGRFVVPAGGPNPGAEPSLPGPTTAGPTGAPTPTPSLPAIPTPPARPADQLAAFAGRVSDVVGIPVVAVQAYAYAQLSLEHSDPGCHLSWTTLAAIGQVESHHGQSTDGKTDNAVLLRSGRSSPVIAGPPLDGQGGRPLVRDTDAGAYDGDATYDREMGPLHLLPSVWRVQAVDADNDGILDPYDVDDASLALGRLLCSAKTDMSTLSGWNTAVARYRAGDAYAKSVFALADGYGQRTRTIT